MDKRGISGLIILVLIIAIAGVTGMNLIHTSAGPASADADDIPDSHPLATSLNEFKYKGNPILARVPGTWESVDIHHFSVLAPDSTPDSLWHGWYAGADGKFNRIGHAVSYDGIHWMKDEHNPVFFIGNKSVNDPYVVPLQANGTVLYYMYFELYDPQTKLYSIGLAKSGDGITWEYVKEVLAADPRLSDEIGVSVPLVLHNQTGNSWYMLFSGLYQVEPEWIIWTGLALSDDGINWTKKTVLVEPDTGKFVFPHACMETPEGYTGLFVFGADDIRPAFSGDLIHWSIHKNSIISKSESYEVLNKGNTGIGTDGLALVKYHGTYYIYYSYYGHLPYYRDLGLIIKPAG